MYIKDVYTSLDGLELEKANVISMRELGALTVEWITETAIKRLEKRTPSEIKAKEELSRLFPEVEEQVYFRIDGRSYFVGLFIPEHNVAVEIDEWYHYGGKRMSFKRDKTFDSIGIRTARIDPERVMGGFFKEDFMEEARKLQQSERFVPTRSG